MYEKFQLLLDKTNKTPYQAIVAVFTFIKDNILTPFSDFLEKVFRVNFEKTFGLVGMYMESWGKTLKDIVNSVKQVFQGIIDFVTGVFSSNWSQAWNGVKEIFSGVWGAFAGIVKSPINAREALGRVSIHRLTDGFHI